MGEACVRPDCSGGVIDEDGYCTECGLAPLAAATGSAKAAATGSAAASAVGVAAAGAAAVGASAVGTRCVRPDCSGTIDADGFCDECGLAPEGGAAAAAPVLPAARRPPGSASVRSLPSGRTGSARSMSGRSRSHRSTRTGTRGSVSVRSSKSTGTTTGRPRLGAGLVTVPSVPSADPAQAVLENPEVPERKRFCSKCERPVGREKNGRPGRPDGFCSNCGTAYSFTPKLRRGDLVGGQYEVLGCLAHGGLGWIYLAVDRRVSDRWVVLKGLLDSGDEDALAAAIAERRFLAEVDHPNIVRIINFVEHPDLRTGSTDGYIVMEYVGGKSLKDIANERRTPDGRREPLPVEQAIAYALEALPALGYLHGRGLVYCDFKIDNVIQSEDSLKVIDMGAVRRLDDDGPIYGTVGYQAPEIATEGPSAASDLYTVARTLAVLTFDFQGYSTTWVDELPGPEQVPVFAEYESFYRLLVRATDPDPGRRFASAEEMADQLTGVLREILALKDSRPRPALSTLFGPELRVVDTELVTDGEPPAPGLPRVAALDAAAAALALPVPRVDPGDPNAGFLAALMATRAADVLSALQGAPVNSVERRLRELRALIELGRHTDAAQALAELQSDHADDWRVVWYRGLSQLTAAGAAGEAAQAKALAEAAAEAFDAIYDAFPGESAPKLALAVCAELLGRGDDAAEFYRLVWSTDHAYVSAAFGLARVSLAAGDRSSAVGALESVPETSSHYTAARIAGIRARLRERPGAEPLGADLLAGSAQLTALGLEDRRREQLSVEVLDAALGWVLAGRPTPTASHPLPVGDADVRVLGHPARERELRFALERSYRVLARLAERSEDRIELVERANRTRPRTWV
ncbi:serine/threonine-protein kinase PknG [Kitasatospora sp. NBC_01287]|uniref:serine/threonine-protein kinase n=1 Tax=Kitasatospora sp. NBC_01287 TaxID=2903573 RepID=UPI002259B8A7|nr:serine/threonine-protein kinase [Kitasatospora sp. NBC_01287]MCX4746342.1 serine/threonine-protein kinase PknG [Kitasatospora sp. NBC_01287]